MERLVCEGEEGTCFFTCLSLTLVTPPRILGGEMREVGFGREMGMLVGGMVSGDSLCNGPVWGRRSGLVS